MPLRAPAYPLITVDPYFSVWSMADTLCGNTTLHWTGKPNTMIGIINIDGTFFTFMGQVEGQACLHQTNCILSALSTLYEFEGAGIRLTARFTTPLLLDDLQLVSRLVSYLALTATSTDGKVHTVEATIRVSEEICLDTKGQFLVNTSILDIAGHATISIGSIDQPVLEKSGDDLRIDWGYFYLSSQTSVASASKTNDMTYVEVKTSMAVGGASALFVFAYDDGYSIEYFGRRLKSLWNQNGTPITQIIAIAFDEYDTILEQCNVFDKNIQADAILAGGEEYADLLNLTYRQSIAAHKLVIDENGEILWISKECFSNGCAATVDVTYPSIPLFLLYNTELVKGMLRPIFKYVESDAYPFDFAPHDVGQYPLLRGIIYGKGDPKFQMPVEECGNVLLIVAAITAVDGNACFASQHLPMLEKWQTYLLNKGLNPDNQLCTDDFAGHLAHNCNLSLKAICAIGAFSRVYRYLDQPEKAEQNLKIAKEMADNWVEMAANGDGSFMLAFDRPGTFSMKYNLVWDQLMDLQLFPPCVIQSEIFSYARHMRPYGLPLDSRADYTKSDWLVWIAAMTSTIEEFKAMIHPLWLAYHFSPSRVPATDWYSTTTALQRGFQNRSVQGGLFIKLLSNKGLCR